MNYGPRIKDLRKAAGIKQVTLAKKLGWTSSQLCARENGPVGMTKAEFMGAEVALADIRAEQNQAYEKETGAVQPSAAPVAAPGEASA